MPQFPVYIEHLFSDGLSVKQGNSLSASLASQGRMYYDSSVGHVRFSENTGAGFSVGKVRSIASVGSLSVGSLTADGALDLDVDETWTPQWVGKHLWIGATTTTKMIGFQVAADSEDRFQVSAGGILYWGSGSAAQDVTLYWGAANLLKTDDSFQALSLLAQNASAFIKVNNGSSDTFHVNASGAVLVGSWTATVIGISYGGTGASTAQGARVNLLPSLASQTGKYLRVNAGETDVEWASGTGGAVTSVALSMPSQFSVSGSPITTSGTLSVSWGSQSINYFLAGPSTGSAGSPSFRAITGNDLGLSPSSGALLYLNGSALTWLSGGANRKVLQMNASIPSWQSGNDFIEDAPTSGNSSADGTSTSSWLTIKDSGGAGSNNFEVTIPSSSETVKPYYLVVAKISMNFVPGSDEFDGAIRLVYDPGGGSEAVVDISLINYTPTGDVNGDTFTVMLMGTIQAGSSSKTVLAQLKSNDLESAGGAWPYIVHADATFGNPCSRLLAIKLL